MNATRGEEAAMPAEAIRSKDHAARHDPSGDEEDQKPPKLLVLFRAGELRLGIDVRQVREVARAIPPSVPLPNARGLVGMITLRGESAAVVDLNVVLGVPCAQRDRRARLIVVHHNGAVVCLLVDQIDGLHDVTEADLETPPSVIADLDIRWLDYVARSRTGELIGVVHLDRLLSQISLARMEVETASV